MSDGKDELRQRFDQTRNTEDEDNAGDEGNPDNTDNAEPSDDTGNAYDWGDKYNYPFYVPREFADELDKLYNQYDGKNKVEGGEGLEKHREFLFPIMKSAIEEQDLDEVVDWETEEDD